MLLGRDKRRGYSVRTTATPTQRLIPNSALEFSISGVKTTLPPGFTNLYVTFREFQNYGTQTIVTQIEKSPLIYNSGLNAADC